MVFAVLPNTKTSLMNQSKKTDTICQSADNKKP